MIAALQTQLGDKVRFLIIDVGDRSDSTTHKLLQKYQVYSIPTYLFFDQHGELVGQYAGYLDPVDLSERIAALIPR